MITAIVYTSFAGHTRAYAEMLGARTNLPVFSLKDAMRAVPEGSGIVYLGCLTAGTVEGYKKASSRYRVVLLGAVGMSGVDAQKVDVIRTNHLPESLPVFMLQGGFEMDKLHGIHKFMMKAMKGTVGKRLASKEDRTAEEEEVLDLLMNGGDRVSEANLEPLWDKLSELGIV